MVSHLFFYQLVLLGLLWLCVMLHYAWPNECAGGDQRPSQPLPPPRKRSSDPKLFPGLTRKPPCAACEQAHEHGPQPPGCPPPRMAPTRGRPRQVDTSSHFCPDPDCTYGGWLGLGNITSNGHPSGGPWRQLHCTGCGGYCQETHGTPLHGKRVVPERLVWAVGALAEGLGIRAVARVFEVDPNTVLQWLVEVADHAAAFTQYFLHDVRVTQVQLDELFALLSAVKAGEVSDTEAIQRLSRSPHWVWVAMDPVTKLLLTLDVGDRTLAMAQHVVHQVVQVLAPGCMPLFLTDGFKAYTTALLTHYGQWVQPARQRAQGPAPKPRWMVCFRRACVNCASPEPTVFLREGTHGLGGPMTIDTPLHAEHQLDQLAGQFAHWRQTRPRPFAPIPSALWDQAVALAAALPPARVAHHIRVRVADLTKQMVARQVAPLAGPAPTSLGFVEVPPVPRRRHPAVHPRCRVDRAT